MDVLRNLEQAQRTLMLMESHGIVTTDASSNRFLADFILFMVQPCGELDCYKKCNMISDNLPKISPEFLYKVSQLLFEDGYQEKRCENTLQLNCVENPDIVSLQSKFEESATVGFNAMQRANSTLEDFCRSYFMFHGIDVKKPQSFFKYLPILSFTESFIYQIDIMNEKIIMDEIAMSEGGPQAQEDHRRLDKLLNEIKSDPFRPLMGVLESLGILKERIIEEFRRGEEYWEIERALCSALMSKKEIFVEDVIRAIHLKSFDYRVLNLLLYQLKGEKVNQLHMDFLSISEFLVEVADDLYDYEDDVLENNFNILRMFIAIYGDTAPAVLAKYITEAEEKYERLLKTLDPQLSLHYQLRCEEATREGGKISGHPFGTWTIPPLILDENSFRQSVRSRVKLPSIGAKISNCGEGR